MSKELKGEMYLRERELGMTYREIEAKYGITPQAVHTSCMMAGGASCKVITTKSCIWPNLRKWLNQDKQRQDQFFWAMSGCPIRLILNGTQHPKENIIDKMLSLTGMSYEELFAEEGI